MLKLVDLVTLPELVSTIVQQFSFMKMMAEPQDSNFKLLEAFDLNDLHQRADDFFVHFTTYESVIDTNECDLTSKITLFLDPYSMITDVTAVQQNIHYQLQRMNND